MLSPTSSGHHAPDQALAACKWGYALPDTERVSLDGAVAGQNAAVSGGRGRSSDIRAHWA